MTRFLFRHLVTLDLVPRLIACVVIGSAKVWLLSLWSVCIATIPVPWILGANATIQEQEQQSVESVEFAWVEGQSIGIAEVQFLLSRLQPVTDSDRILLGQWSQVTADSVTADSVTASAEAVDAVVDAEIPKNIIDAAVEKWVQRLVVLSFLAKNNLAISQEQAESDVRRQDAALVEAGTDLATYLRRTGLSRESYVSHRRWEMSWQEYAAKKVTDESLQKYFQLHRIHYDGTRLKVAHIILLKTKTVNNGLVVGEEAEVLVQMEKLNTLRTQVSQGKLTFAQAAAANSEGASAQQGGHLCWIDRGGPMVEAFNRAAFSTEKGQISEAFPTAHGVHIVKVLEVENGVIPYLKVKEQVRIDALADLWRLIVSKHEDNVSVRRRP